MFGARAWCLIGAIGISFFGKPLQAGNKNALLIGYGVYGIRGKTTLAGRLEYRLGHVAWLFHPMVGLQLSTDGSRYAYGGLNYDIPLSSVFYVSLNVAAGAYDRDGGKDLGGVVEFKSGLGVGMMMSRSVLMSISFHHISNASLYRNNPGIETIQYNVIFLFR